MKFLYKLYGGPLDGQEVFTGDRRSFWPKREFFDGETESHYKWEPKIYGEEVYTYRGFFKEGIVDLEWSVN